MSEAWGEVQQYRSLSPGQHYAICSEKGDYCGFDKIESDGLMVNIESSHHTVPTIKNHAQQIGAKQDYGYDEAWTYNSKQLS